MLCYVLGRVILYYIFWLGTGVCEWLVLFLARWEGETNVLSFFLVA